MNKYCNREQVLSSIWTVMLAGHIPYVHDLYSWDEIKCRLSKPLMSIIFNMYNNMQMNSCDPGIRMYWLCIVATFSWLLKLTWQDCVVSSIYPGQPYLPVHTWCCIDQWIYSSVWYANIYGFYFHVIWSKISYRCSFCLIAWWHIIFGRDVFFYTFVSNIILVLACECSMLSMRCKASINSRNGS